MYSSRIGSWIPDPRSAPLNRCTREKDEDDRQLLASEAHVCTKDPAWGWGLVICNDPKVSNHSLMMTIHTCISSRYVISLTNTTMFDCVKLMNNSRKQLLPKTLITPREKRGQQFLLCPFVGVGLASPRRSNDSTNVLPTEHTHYLVLPATIQRCQIIH
jgi:hypothetical protein